MIANESIAARREMLARWYLDALRRYDRALRSSRSQWFIRIGGRSYYVTGEQLHGALDATYHELHVGLAARRTWGVDSAGEAAYVAIVGLAQRRLQARVIDEIRRGQRIPEVVDVVGVADGDEFTYSRAAGDPADYASTGILDELTHESTSTKAVVLMAGAGYTAPEIGARLGIKPAAARQRLSRFARRVRVLQEAA